jgi:hypothetical protein
VCGYLGRIEPISTRYIPDRVGGPDTIGRSFFRYVEPDNALANGPGIGQLVRPQVQDFVRIGGQNQTYAAVY